jgi:hypothetical protein
VLLLALFVFVLETWRTGRARRPGTLLVALPLTQVVWTNCQGLSPLGPALLAAYLLGEGLSRWWAARRPGSEQRTQAIETEPAGAAAASGTVGGDTGPSLSTSPALRPLAVALVLCLVAGFITPYGLDAVALPFRLLARLAPLSGNVFSGQVAENVPPLILARTDPEQVAHFPWALALMGVLAVATRARLPAAHLLVLAGFLGLALAANRNVLLLYVVAAPLLAAALVRTAAPRGGHGRESTAAAAGASAPPVGARRRRGAGDGAVDRGGRVRP